MTEPAHAMQPATRSSTRSHGPAVGMAALVAAAGFAFGWPTRCGEFLRGDDHRFVVEQVFVNHPSLDHAWHLLTMVHDDLYQPLPMLSFQANYAFAADDSARFGISPFAFHLTNILLHMLNASLAFGFVLLLTRCRRIALLVGLMFACHPLALEPVAWISGRMILLATSFSLLLLLLCLLRREDGRGPWAWLAGLAWLAALLSKVMPTVPLAAALCDRCKYGKVPRRACLVYALLLVLAGGGTWLAAATTHRFGMIDATEAESTTAAPVRLLLAGRYYLESYVWPNRMSAWSPPAREVALLSAETGTALLEFAMFVLLMARARRRNRVCFLGLALFLILLAPFLAATLGRRILTADRYMYLPMLGLHLAVAAAAVRAMDRLGNRCRTHVAIGVVALPCLAVLIAWTAVARNHAVCWGSTVARDRRIVDVYPDRVEAHAELAKAHIFQNDPAAALRVIAMARQRWPDDAMLASEAGEAHRLMENWAEAAGELACAAEKLPDRARTQYHYALTLERLGRDAEARAAYRRILERHAAFLPAATALARSYRTGGDLEAAAATFERVIRINPRHRDSLFELALLRIRGQDWRRAETLLRSILGLDPQDAPALLNLGVILTHLGRTEEAVAIYDRLLLLDPSAVAARINRAGLLVNTDRASEAEAEYRGLLAEHPGHRAAALGLHELLQRQQRFVELVDLWEDIRSIGANIADLPGWLTWAYVLAGDLQQARQTVARMSPSPRERVFAGWALAYEALRSGDLQAFRQLLGAAQNPGAVAPEQRDEARVILAALSRLPESIRNSPAGLYALARAMLFGGDRSAARAVLPRVLETPHGPEWSDPFRELSEALGVHDRAAPGGGAG